MKSLMNHMDMDTLKFIAECLASTLSALGILTAILVRLYTYRASAAVQHATLKIVERTYMRRDVAEEKHNDLSRQIQELRRMISHA